MNNEKFYFTQDNTNGFSSSDLDVLNEVLDFLILNMPPAKYCEDDVIKGYRDWINNAWCEGDTAESLLAKLRVG